jgi:hypothetical protein
MATVTMREIREGEVPFAAGTAVQEDPARPVFSGNGPDDYVCVKCGNVLAASMSAMTMTKKVRVKCAVCKTVNVAVTGE